MKCLLKKKLNGNEHNINSADKSIILSSIFPPRNGIESNDWHTYESSAMNVWPEKLRFNIK